MIKLNLVGDNFTHTTDGNLGYSTARKRSRYIEWVFDGSGIGTMYVDKSIPSVLESDDRGLKFAWLLESDPMAPPVLRDLLDNDPAYDGVFDMIFTHNRELLDRGHPYCFSPGSCTWVHEIGPRPKSRLVSMVSSSKNMCEGHARRLEWVEKLRDHVDLYGRGFNFVERKEDGIESYRFSVAIENDTTPSYFSEKLLDCFATQTVPIYFGTPDIDEFFNPDGIIMLDDSFDVGMLSEGLYEEMLPAIVENCRETEKYDVGEDFLWISHLREIYGKSRRNS